MGSSSNVHCTLDRVVVVHHDEIPRATPPSGRLAGKRIDALTFDELQGFSVRGLALISTLEEALAVIKGRANVFVELKGAAIEHEVIDVIRGSIAPARCAVHSFDHAQVARARVLAPEIRGGILFDRPIPDAVAAMRAADALECVAEPRARGRGRSWSRCTTQAAASFHGRSIRPIRPSSLLPSASTVCAPISFRCCAPRSDIRAASAAGGTRGALSTFYLAHRSSRSAEARPAMRIVVFTAALTVLACSPAKGAQAPAPQVASAGDSTQSKDSKDSTTAGTRRVLGSQRRSVSEHL